MVAVALAGCGTTTYFAGRNLPPSGLVNRVLIAIQNPSSFTKGSLEIVDAFYDVRFKYNSPNASSPAFSVSGYSGALPVTIQNMPEEQLGAVYGSGDGSFTLINYAKESTSGAAASLGGLSSSVFITRSQAYVFAATKPTGQTYSVLSVANKTNGSSYQLSLPGAYRVSVNPGGSVALAFVQNSNYVYYPRILTAAQTIAYSGGPATWPLGAVDCEPQNGPGWCLFELLDPSSTTGNIVPLTFNRPVKAVFSADGGTAYILSCGPECGGNTAPAAGFPATAAVTAVPVAPLIYLLGQESGTLPTQTALNSATISIPGGASNALVDSSTLLVVGQAPVQVQGQTLFGGNLTAVDLSKSPAAVSSAVSISDGAPGAVSRMLLADDNTLWIGMTQCNNGVRAGTGQPYGCLTMVNVANPASPSVTLLEPYSGDLTGIAGVTGLHKIYVAQGGQVYIYTTTDGTAKDNQYVTVTGTAYDVAYMDGLTDGNNTVY
jgi:hypothetical protein